MREKDSELDRLVTRLDDWMLEALNRLDMPNRLKESMAYSIQAGGKRIRPRLIFATLDAFRKDMEIGIPAAAAVEMIHTYSLIHDDLPSMDNDDFRRGKPTNHRVFGEAMAILAGDALLTHSFQILAEIPEQVADLRTKLALVLELAKAAGPEGMVAGQVADLEGENRTLTLEELEYIHTRKTGRLIGFSVLAGALLAGAEQPLLKQLRRFAGHIGLAFQIRDDILDVEGSTETIGKTAGKDQAQKKSTYPSLLSLSGAKDQLQNQIREALVILHGLPLNTKRLEQLTLIIGNRDF
jgi:farnesyl-diphosphate synthase (EC 2.5.1.10)